MTGLKDVQVLNPIDRASALPYYAQVKEVLRGQIENGTLKVGVQLPGEPELCEIFRVSRTVIRQALADLLHDGLIVKEKGKGTFVAEPKIMENLIQRLTGFYQDMADRGTPPVSQVLKQRSVPSNSKVGGFLKLQPGTPVIEIERLRFVQKEPLVLVTTYLPDSLCRDLLNIDLTRRSLYTVLERNLGLIIDRGRRTLEAVPANQYEADLLRIEKGAPLMLLESVSYLSDGTPIEYYHALHRGDRSRFESELIRFREPDGREGLESGARTSVLLEQPTRP